MSSMDLVTFTEGFPPCSIPCLNTTLDSLPTLRNNIVQLCFDVPLEKSLHTCVATACTFPDQQKVVSANNLLCASQPTENKVLMATIVLSFLGMIANLMIGLRLYTRKRLASALGIGIDDWLMIAAAGVLSWVTVSGSVEVVALGLGRHTFNVDPKFLLPDLILYWSDEIAYQIEMTLIKSSILCFYLRLFPERNFRIMCYIMITFAVSTGIAFLGITIFQCDPIRGVFDKSVQAKCIDTNTFTYAASGFSIVTDFTILLMPIPRLLKLKVPRKQRNSVLIVFSFGFIASIISVIRLPFIIEFGKTTDPLFDNIGPGIWTFTEMASAIIAACLPTLKPLAAKVFPRYFSNDAACDHHQHQVEEGSPAPRLDTVVSGRSIFWGRGGGKGGGKAPKILWTLPTGIDIEAEVLRDKEVLTSVEEENGVEGSEVWRESVHDGKEGKQEWV